MDKRQEELTKLKSYIEGIDNELTVILETLQWDRKELLQVLKLYNVYNHTFTYNFILHISSLTRVVLA